MSKLIIRKIPIFDLLDLLHDMYDDGYDYVDITGNNYKNRDDVFFSVRDEYLSPPPKKLIDEDLNQLI